jgi:Bacterial Ig domain
MRTPAAALLVLLLALLAACDYEPRGRCASQQDCLAGQVCTGGVCAAEAAEGPVGPAPHAPVAAADAYVVAAGAILDVPPASGVLVNDSDPDGDPLTAEKVADPSYGIAFLSQEGAVVYVPALGFSGTDTFTYRASDGLLRSDVTAVTVTVVP